MVVNFVSKRLDQSETTLRLEEGAEMEQGCEIHAADDGDDGVSQGDLRNDEVGLEDCRRLSGLWMFKAWRL
jgi:hypothetical protein